MTSTDRSALIALVEAERRANVDGDVDVLMSLRAPDFTAMPPGMTPIRGAEDVRAFIAQSFEEGTVTELRFTPEDLRVDGDLAVARVHGEGAMQLATGDVMRATLSVLFVARRDESGWSWIYCAWNVLPE